MRSAPRCGAGTVAVVVLASADDLLLHDVVAIPVLAAVRHGHRGIATAVTLVVPGGIPLLIAVVGRRSLRIAGPWSRCGAVGAAVVVRVAVARRCRLIVAARCAIAVALACRPGHADAHHEHRSQNEPQHLHSSKPRCLNAPTTRSFCPLKDGQRSGDRTGSCLRLWRSQAWKARYRLRRMRNWQGRSYVGRSRM